MRPSVVLEMKRSAVRDAVSRFRTANPRVFGSVLHGTDHDGSDIDLLVEFRPGARPTLLDMAQIEAELSAVFHGRKVDLRTALDLSPYFRDEVLRTAQVLCHEAG